jgi:trehalose 6-phosphate synthase/phosphatase
MAKSQLVLVSNRLPVSVKKVDGKLTFDVSSGGLATALSGLMHSGNTVWIGWPGISSDELTAADKRTISQELHKHGCIPVHLTKSQIANFYEGYANATLWPLFHYFPQYSQHSDVYWTEYKQVNQLFAKTVAAVAGPDATIWVHDYQLMLVPSLLRKTLPTSSIGFFMHIPFPSYEIFRLLPQRKEILNGLLGADLVGFHVYDYATHFAHSVQRILGHEHNLSTIMLGDRLVRTDAFPIGIDYAKYAAASQQPEVKAEIDRLRNHYGGQRLILSMDRLDYSKGIVNRLEAFDGFLEHNPHYHGQVALAMVAVPSRTEVEAYRTLRDTVEQTVSRINGKYGTVDWTPISYQFKNLPFEQIAALYNESHAALITPLRDGMNLVAKEFVAVKQKTPGVLIISEMTGVVDELPEATKVNPNDKAAMIRAIERAMTMPVVQQRRRMRIMQARLSKYTVKRWAEDFLEQLRDARSRRSKHLVPPLSRRDNEQLVQDFQAAKSRLILLDYDGTLTDFVASPDPDQARPTPRVRQILTKLASAPNTRVAILSGRSRGALSSWFSRLPLTLSAEHGAWLHQDGAWSTQLTDAVEWKTGVWPVLLATAERTPGSMIEEKDHTLVWHYRNVTPDLAYVRNTKLRHDLKAALAGTDVGVYEGHKVIEIKPRNVSKAIAAQTLLADTPYDFVLAIGDDFTDEEMFAALPEFAYTIKVGQGESRARSFLPGPTQVVKLLAELAKKGD